MKINDLWKKYLMEHKPIRVIFTGEDYGIYKYNEKLNRYEGEIGHIKFEDVLKILNEFEEVNHIKIEMI